MVEVLRRKEETRIGIETGKKAEREDLILARIGVSLPSNLLDKFDKIIRKRGYSSRSEGIRDAIRGYMIEYEWMEYESGEKTGTITYICHTDQKGLRDELEKIEDSFGNIIKVLNRVPIDDKSDLVIIAVKGDAERIKELTGAIMSQKGVKSVKLTTH